VGGGAGGVARGACGGTGVPAKSKAIKRCSHYRGILINVTGNEGMLPKGLDTRKAGPTGTGHEFEVPEPCS
jgi:hypothetical protein